MNADSQLADDHALLVVEVFRMLADATRVQLLWSLIGGELSVNDLAERVGKPAPSVSQHLAKLRMARLVRTRREGTAGHRPGPSPGPRVPTARTVGVGDRRHLLSVSQVREGADRADARHEVTERSRGTHR